MSMSNQSQTERTRVIMIPSAIYSFKTTVKTSCLQTILQRTDIGINNRTVLFKKNKIRNYKRDKYCQYECFYIYKCRLRSELSQLLVHLFQRTSLVKVGQFGPFARMKGVLFFFFQRELTTNTTTFSTFVTLQRLENRGAALEVNISEEFASFQRKMSVKDEGLTWRKLWSWSA